MLDILRLDHVQICIPIGEEENAKAFYLNLLGFTEIEKPDSLKSRGGFWFQVADVQVHIGTEDIPEKSKSHPAFEVRDVEAARKWLSEKGIPIKEAVEIPNVKRFYFIDPFGNRIELLEHIQ